MNTSNKELEATENMNSLKPQAACCDGGCGCHFTGKAGKARWAMSAIVLLVAGVLVVRAITKTDHASHQPQSTAFANPVAATSGTASHAPPVVVPETTAVVPTESAPATVANPSAVAQPAAASGETMIGGFAELNTVAAKSDAVFVYLLGKEATADNAPAIKAMQAAVRTIEAKGGSQCALFTLKAGSPDYDKLAGQMSLPGVLALVKGKGMSAVSGEITETKLVQGYVAASSAGGCGSGECGSASGGCK